MACICPTDVSISNRVVWHVYVRHVSISNRVVWHVYVRQMFLSVIG